MKQSNWGRVVYLTAVAMFLALSLAAMPSPVRAKYIWCKADPIVRVGERVYRIEVGLYENREADVTGTSDFRVTHLSSLSHETLFTDTGFNGKGERVVYGTRSSATTSISFSVATNGGDITAGMWVYDNTTGALIAQKDGTTDQIRVDIPQSR